MIKIIKKPCGMMEFSEIPIGGVFEFNNTIYVKIQDLKSDYFRITFNVVCLSEENTEVKWLEPYDKVTYYPNAELILSF